MDKKLESILNQSLDQVMSDRFGRYSKYIIQGRALPDARDGLKPVQRRILFSMNELGLIHSSAYKKSARVVGDVIGKYHPHGDSSIYEAMIRMAQDWKMNVPLVDMHGNKGSIDDDPAAAMRYTEARLAKISSLIIDNIKKNTVSFAPNFDDSEKEPTVMPGLFPNLLVNGAKGIAAGYATEMPPHNLGEIIDAIVYRIQNPQCNLDAMLNIVKGPDFPTGGTVQGLDGIYAAFERGQGKVLVRSNYTVNTSKQSPFINITEIPFGVVKQNLVRTIDEIRFNKKIDGIKVVRDESDRNGISIMIELAAGVDVGSITNYLLQKTEMQVYYNYNNIVIHNHAPKQMGIIALIDAYLEHQKDVQTKAIKFDLEKDRIRLEIVEGFIKVAGIADAVIDVIRKSEGSKQGVVIALCQQFGFTELQATAIADLRLYRLSKTDQNIYLKEAEELRRQIRRSQSLLRNESMFNEYLVEILQKMKQEFATPRKTKIEAQIQKIEINMEDLIKHEDVWVGVSKQGYIKRVSPKIYDANKFEEYALKSEDSVVCLEKVNTIDKLIIFTDKGRYIYVPIHTIAEAKWKEHGKHINDFAVLEADELVVDAYAVNDFQLNANFVLMTSRGKIKRTALKEFELTRYNKPSQAFPLLENEKLIGVCPSNGYMQIVAIANNSRAVRYPETQVPVQGTKSSGVIGMALTPGAEVTTMVVVHDKDVIGMLSRRGGVKRIKSASIMPMARTTQGRSIYREVKGNPHVVIDAAPVTTASKFIFLDNTNATTFLTFADIALHEGAEGFSLVGPSNVIAARIMKPTRIFAGASLFDKKLIETDEEKMKQAEEKIEAASQISIDDILKDLKIK